MNVNELIDETLSLSSRICPKDYGDQPCIYCLECPRADLQEFESGSFRVRRTVNSAEITYELSARDEFDLLLVRVVKSNLEEFPWVLESNRPTELKMFVGLEDIQRTDRRKKIRNFLKELPLFGQIFTRGRSAIKKWASQEMRKLKERISP